jgi:hypothetical protein
MAHLTLTGVSDDGKRLLLVAEDGTEHSLEIDERVRSAVRGATSSRRWEKTTMESTLRPRDIQARIRAGESPEAVAEAASTSVDKIMAFAAPVLAERQHVADRAQRSSVRREAGQAAGGARTLGDAVAAHLRSVNVDPEAVEWDSWRREDGRWSLVGRYSTAERSGTAELTFDAPGNYVTLENDDARWLVGETIAAAPAATDDLRQARQRRLSAAQGPDDELPLGADAIDLVSERPLEAFLDDEPLIDDAVRADEEERREEAADAAAEDRAGVTSADAADEPASGSTTETTTPATTAETNPETNEDTKPGATAEPAEPSTRRPVKKSRGRASVPSWDEIMFGGGKKE